MAQGPHLLGRRGQQRCRGWARGWVPHKIQTNISLHVQPFEVFSVNSLKKKLGLRWADSPRNFVLKEEDLLTQAEKTPNTVSRPYTGASRIVLCTNVITPL